LKSDDSLQAVDDALMSYADRGVFRGFAGRRLAGSRSEYRFLWLTETPFVLHYDAGSQTLTFKNLLPNVPYPSPMDRSFRAFLRLRTSASLPEHRRIDPERARVSCANRAGMVSVSLQSMDDDVAYAVGKAMALVGEIFHSFLRGPYFEYMVENFNESEE